jgi:hypothetical protein
MSTAVVRGRQIRELQISFSEADVSEMRRRIEPCRSRPRGYLARY